MKKLIELKDTLAANALSITASTHIKGGNGDAVEDEKRRQRPGGGVSTNSEKHNDNWC